METTWLSVNVHPNAGKDVLIALGPGRFEAWVKAKPTDGQANDAVARLLARTFHIPPQRVRLIKGRSGRHKLFQVTDWSGAA